MLSYIESKLSRMTSTYGTRLAEALGLADKDRQQLADAIGVSVQAIGQVIAGKTKALTAENSERAARFLRVDPFWLATGEGAPTKLDSAGAIDWPFLRVTAQQWEDLPVAERSRIEGFVEAVVLGATTVKSKADHKAA